MTGIRLQGWGGFAWSCRFDTHNDLRHAADPLSGGPPDTIYAEGWKSVRLSQSACGVCALKVKASFGSQITGGIRCQWLRLRSPRKTETIPHRPVVW